MDLKDSLAKAVEALKRSRRTLLFTGAGISVESGIPPFRGPGGLWTKCNPDFIEINHFLAEPEESWRLIKEVFYDNWGAAKPNKAHYAAAAMERKGLLRAVVTQNIDCLHQRAGSSEVLEFHGTLDKLACLDCKERFLSENLPLYGETPHCPLCKGLLKPDIVFFGEAIPEAVSEASFAYAQDCDAVIVVGTTGEVMPAGLVPRAAKSLGATVIEVNIGPSELTRSKNTDIFLGGKAGEILPALAEALGCA